MGFLPINVGGVSPASDFTYPAGEYILQCVEAKVEPTKAGDGHRCIIKSKIVMGPGPSLDMQNKPITHSYALTDKSRPFIVRFALSCGVTQEQINAAGGQIDTDWFLGRQYVVRISQRDQYTNVDKERPLAAWSHGAVAGQPATGPQVTQQQPGLLQPMPGAAPQMAPQAAPQAAPPQQVAPPLQAQAVQPQYQAQQPQTAIPVPQAPDQMQQAQAQQQVQFQQSAVGLPAPPPPGGTVPQQ